MEDVTPVILTYNEAPNIERTLKGLEWARDIVVVDSGSSDGTMDILAGRPNVRVFHRAFDSHADQWRFAVEETGIETGWILRLDADYVVTEELVHELSELTPAEKTCAYRIDFDYAVFSRTLRASIYPSNTVLLRRGFFTVEPKGHTEVWSVHGNVETLRGRIVHDDWKPVRNWINSQGRYMALELDQLKSGNETLKFWLRKRPPLMPIAVLLYCVFAKGLLLDGRRGLFYIIQRVVSELILSLMILEDRFSEEK